MVKRGRPHDWQAPEEPSPELAARPTWTGQWGVTGGGSPWGLSQRPRHPHCMCACGPGHLTSPADRPQQLRKRGQQRQGRNLSSAGGVQVHQPLEGPGRQGGPGGARTGAQQPPGLRRPHECRLPRARGARAPRGGTRGDPRRPTLQPQGPPCHLSPGPSSPEASSGRRVFLATSASAPKPRPTARPARRGGGHQAFAWEPGCCLLASTHQPPTHPPQLPGDP